MVQILIKIKDSPESVEEWVIMEVQGDFESNSGSSLEGKMVGQLLFLSKEKPVLIVGYHILYGKIVENNPSMAVVQKLRDHSANAVSVPIPKDKSTTYSVLALVKKRIVFKTRPKPIVTPE